MTVIPARLDDPLNWLPRTPTYLRALVERARQDIARVIEIPTGSNRGPEIDAYNLRAGVPLGSYWCASAVGAWWLDCGLEVPKGYASCDNWMAWAKATGRWHTTPIPGAAVLYGKPGDASHIGLIVRTPYALQTLTLSIEGNTTIEGAAYGTTRNGVAVSLKEVNDKDPVLGYCYPFAPQPEGR